MRNRIFLLIIILMILSGGGMLLFPIVSNWVMMHFRELEIVHYGEAAEQMDQQHTAAEMEKAKAYNEALTGANIEDPFIPGSGIALPDNYTDILNIDGAIGYITIPKINVYLPVYHGVGEEVLQKGVGHLEHTAFPIGGEGNHAVLTGHSGLPYVKLFTDLPKLAVGDLFYIAVMDRELTYEVDQIRVIMPDETEPLRPVEARDYVTLVTCTPYGINSHRLLVRGQNISSAAAPAAAPESGAAQWTDWGAVTAVAAVIISVAAALGDKLVRRRRLRKQMKREQSQ